MAMREISFHAMADAVQMPSDKCTAIISITNPGVAAPIQDGWGAVLRVSFSDAEYDDGSFARAKARGVRFDPALKGFPTQVEAAAVREFLAMLGKRQEITRLVVHCHAGRRRSTAVASYASDLFGVPLSIALPACNQTVLRLLRDPLWRASGNCTAARPVSIGWGARFVGWLSGATREH